MEKMTDKEIEQLKKLQAKQKRIDRHNSEFRSEVLEKKDEVIKLLELDKTFDFTYEERIKKVAGMYGLGADELIKILSREDVVQALYKFLDQFKQKRQQDVQTQ